MNDNLNSSRGFYRGLNGFYRGLLNIRFRVQGCIAGILVVRDFRVLRVYDFGV